MKYKDKTQKQLITELNNLRRRIVELEVSERQVRQIEEDLKKSIQERTTILDSVSELVAYQDTHMRILWANRAAGESVGVDPQQLVGRRCYEIWQQRHRPCVGCPVIKTRKSGLPQEAEITSPDGRVWWIHSYPVRDKKGIVTGIVEVTLEITDRKRAVESLRTEKDKAQQYLDIAEVIMVVLNKKGEITLINRKGNQILGYKKGELLGKNWFTICVPSHLRKKIKNGFLKLMAGERKLTDFYENPVLTKSGAERIMGWHNVLLKDAQGNPIGILSSGEDITERREAEAGLKESESRFRNIVENSKDGIIFFDGKTRKIIFGNRAMAELLGCSEGDLIGRSIPSLHPSKEWPSVEREFQKHVRREISFSTEIPVIRNDGSVFYADISSNFITLDGRSYFAAFFRDITERKRAEEELRETEEKLRLFVEHAPVGLAMFDRDMRYLAASRRWISDFHLNESNLIDRSHYEIFPELTDELKAIHQRGMNGEVLKDDNAKFERTDGSVQWLHWEMRPWETADGKVGGIVIFSEDITERKQAEEALRESETRFRTLFEAIPDCIIVHDDEGVILHINKIGAQQLEWSEKDLIGRNLRKIVTPENAALIADHIRETHKTGWCRFETAYVSRSGWQIMAEVNDRPINFEGKKAILRVSRDITERKEAEKALQKEKIFSDAVINSSPGLLFVIDDKGNARQWNKKVEMVTGHSASEISEMNIFSFVANDDKKTAAEAIQEALTNGQASIETNIITKSGKKIPFYIIGRRTKIDDITCVVCTGIDITDRKQAEEELQESEERFRTFADEVSFEGLVIHDKGKILDVNRQFAKMHGYEVAELFQIDTFVTIAPESRDLVLKHIQERYEAPYEAVALRKDGSTFPMEIRAKKIPYHGKMVRAVAIRDITERKQAEEKLQESYNQLQRTFTTTVNALASTVEMKDQYTAGHQPRVTRLASAIAEEMGLSQKQIEGIRMAGLIHDIGKIIVPAEILNKPGPLTDIQYEMVKMHPRAGFDILKGIKFPWPVAQIIFQHHELMDGSGYPQGLVGDQIMLEARVLTVANVVEAMTSHRPYRAAHDITAALDEIKKHKGVLYDPDVVDACLRLFNEKGFTLDTLQEPATPPMVS